MNKKTIAFILLISLIIGTIIGYFVYSLIVKNYPHTFNVNNNPVIDTASNKTPSIPEKQVITIKNVNNSQQLKEILDILQQYSKDKKMTELRIEYKKDTTLDTNLAKKQELEK